MNVLRPIQTSLSAVVAFLAVNAGSLLQLAGLGLVIAACAVVFGVVGGLVSGGVALLVVGVAVERAE